MRKYHIMKGHRGTERNSIATARKMNTMVYAMLKMKKPFDPLRMHPNPKYFEMSKAARQYALAV